MKLKLNERANVRSLTNKRNDRKPKKRKKITLYEVDHAMEKIKTSKKDKRKIGKE